LKATTVETTDRTTQCHRRFESGLWGVLFLGIFLYVWKGIEPHLLYYGFGVFTFYPAFSLEKSFLGEVFSTAGGPINALAALLAQTYQASWLGALVVTAGLGTLFVGIRHLLRSGRAERFGVLAWFPVLLVLPVYSYYCENPLGALLAVGLSVWMAVLYGVLPLRTSRGRVGWFLVLFVVAYYLAGASALVFAVIVCLTEALLGRRFVLALVQALLAVGAALVLGRLFFGLGFRALFTVGSPWDSSRAFGLSPLANWLTLVLYVWVPVLVLLAIVGQTLLEADAKKAARSQPSRRKKRTRRDGKSKQVRRRESDPRVLIALQLVLVVAVTVPCLMATRTYKHEERALHYYAQQRDWDSVLALAERMRATNSFTRCGVFDINRALAHQGRLGSELFAFPQESTHMLFMDFEDMSKVLQHTKSLDLYMDLGYLNAAQRNAYEFLDLMGPSPFVFDALIRIHLAKGQYESARTIFGAMQKYVGCGPYVRRWRPIMADPAQTESDALIQSYRAAMPSRDNTSLDISLPLLERLLEDVPDHRLAFEYLMASYLLTHERVELIDHLSLLEPLGYQRLPRHYAEAVLVHSTAAGSPANVQGWTIDPNLQRQFQDIQSTVTRAGGNEQVAFETLAPKYGDTYMFYGMFGMCGVK